mmetsp:Transcript_305/g.396  ORF Transcript_305/g.396 Transcript_305/m.396 type:complete len:231 (-) Transcript_305:524-1216(-)
MGVEIGEEVDYRGFCLDYHQCHQCHQLSFPQFPHHQNLLLHHLYYLPRHHSREQTLHAQTHTVHPFHGLALPNILLVSPIHHIHSLPLLQDCNHLVRNEMFRLYRIVWNLDGRVWPGFPCRSSFSVVVAFVLQYLFCQYSVFLHMSEVEFRIEIEHYLVVLLHHCHLPPPTFLPKYLHHQSHITTPRTHSFDNSLEKILAVFDCHNHNDDDNTKCADEQMPLSILSLRPA